MNNEDLLENLQLHLYNSLKRTKHAFIPLDAGHIKMYVCGPTVYDRAHLGNARPVVVFDVLYRLLKILYPKAKVTYVRNITDVDDKINAAAQERGIDIKTLTDETIVYYHQDMAALNALPPDEEPRATDFIEDMMGMIKTLIDQGAAYESEGHVLFRVSAFERYGELSKKSTEELLAGARVEIADYKENAQDFVLWKPSDENTPGWDSPWGRGRPGWHIECSAMSYKLLGKTFDIHGGGIDLIFPHHENEIAQSCAAHGTDVMANYWLHNGHLMVNGKKMSKSLGNFFTVADVLKDHHGETIRLAMMMTHYRQPLDFREDVLHGARSLLDKIYNALNNVGGDVDPSAPSWELLEALGDDLNTPLAITALHKMVGAVNLASGEEKMALAQTLLASCHLLGLGYVHPQAWFQGNGEDEEWIRTAIMAREKARAQRDFSESDRIRDDLKSKGIVLEDGPMGTTWKRL